MHQEIRKEQSQAKMVSEKLELQLAEINASCSCGGDGGSSNNNDEVAYAKEIKSTIWRNVGLLTLSTHLNYSAYYGIGNLQLLLNSDQLMYSVASKLTLGFYAFASYFFPTLLVGKLGLRRTVILSFLFFITYTLANYYPSWWTLVPTAVLRGTGGGIVWSIKGTCLATWGNQLSKLTHESIEYTVPRFFGIFFGGYQAAFITAVMISSFLIHKPSSVETLDTVILQEECIARYCYEDMLHFFPQSFNGSAVSGNWTQIDSSRIKYAPDDYQTYLLYGVFTVLGVLTITVAMCIHSDKSGSGSGPLPATAFSLVIDSVKHLFQPFDLLLMPSYLYIGVVDAFSGSELSLGLIPCITGVDNIGFVFTIFGATSATFGLLAGYSTKYTGRAPVFMFGFIIHAVVLLAQQYWPLDYSDKATIALVSGGWGIAAVILDVQISAFIGVVYPENSAPVIANFILFQILGNSLWRIFSQNMCLHVQLYVILALLVASTVGYIIIEIVLRIKSQTFRLDDQQSNRSDIFLVNLSETARY